MPQRLRNRSLQRLARASTHAAQLAFDLGQGQLNRREVWRVGRQIPQLTASCRQQFLQAHTLVGTQIVKQDHLSWPQRRSKDMFDICLEHRTRHTSLNHQARTHPCAGQRADRGRICWGVARKRSDCPLAAWGTGVAPCQVQIGAELIDHDQIMWIEVFLLDQKASTLPGITFRGNQRLFLRVRPRARMARPTVQ
jgi:hypothetical protein